MTKNKNLTRNKNLTSVVIPCYNSEQSINELVEKILVQKESCEVILVNDASTDDTWTEIQTLSSKFPDQVLGIDLLKNSGQHAAILTGVKYAKGDVIITMDDDLQHNPSDIAGMAEQVRKGDDLVYGVSKNLQQKAYRNFSSKLSLWVFDKVLGMKYVTDSSAFRAFSRRSAIAFEHFKGGIVDVDAILSWTCQKVATREVEFASREYGRSNYSFRSLLSHAARMVVAFSIVPLRLSFYLGLLTILLAIILIAYVLYNYLFGLESVEGFAFLACAIIFFAGVQLFIIGIFGQYLAAIHMQTLGRPVAAIRKTTSDNAA